MKREQKTASGWRRGVAIAGITAATLLGLLVAPSGAEEFSELLAQVDEALRTNPSRVPREALASCEARRRSAVALYRSGHDARARRRLAFCTEVLHIPARAATAEDTSSSGPTADELQARATAELEGALRLTPDLTNGLRIYRECAACHTPEGWGLENGSVPQIAGQHRTVVIKQLADIRNGNRDAVLMLPYAAAEVIGGKQSVADVAGYIDTLEISTATGKGDGRDLELGKQLFRENCARCHGESGEGNAEEFVPRIQSQHYNYLVRQFEWIRDGKRRNANPEMADQIHEFRDRETHAVLDYVSRLEPPVDMQAPEGWKNPDFANR